MESISPSEIRSALAPEIPLTEEQITKWDNDLITINTLTKSAAQNGYTFVISGGFAVEAHCGGQISRSHGDIDGMIYIPVGKSAEVSRMVEQVLEKETTEWRPRKLEPTEIEFRENTSNKPFIERRRVELHIAERSPDGECQRKKLISSSGQEIDCLVENLDSLAAGKIRMIAKYLSLTNEERSQKSRHLQPQDLTELRRLVTQSEFSREHCLIGLQSYYQRSEKLSPEDAQQKAAYSFHQATSFNF